VCGIKYLLCEEGFFARREFATLWGLLFLTYVSGAVDAATHGTLALLRKRLVKMYSTAADWPSPGRSTFVAGNERTRCELTDEPGVLLAEADGGPCWRQLADVGRVPTWGPAHWPAGSWFWFDGLSRYSKIGM
jgi:hypothetical protein